MLGRGLLYLMANLLHHVLIISGSAKGQKFALVTLHTDPLEIYVCTYIQNGLKSFLKDNSFSQNSYTIKSRAVDCLG